MKKKNIIALLLIPFLIASLCIVTIKTTYHAVDIDIQSIAWDYSDYEPFKVSDGLYRLSASGVSQSNYKISDGNELVWTVRNKDDADTETYAEIVKKGDGYYLKALKEGEVIITCSNQKGTVFRSMTAILYNKGVVLLQPVVNSSQNNIDSTIYYGEYDLVNGEKKPASVQMQIRTIPSSLRSSLSVTTAQNLSFDLQHETVTFTGVGDASLVIDCGDDEIKPAQYSFTVVDEGVNVYTYDDLIACTNQSSKGEIVVLRKSFESKENAYELTADGKVKTVNGQPKLKANNVECYGDYNLTTDQFKLSEANGDVYSFTTTFNQNYISQWNAFAQKNSGYAPITNKVYAGLRVQKDFYGNGYTLNLHNLTFPYEYIDMSDGNGGTIRTLYLTEDNLFRGPLPFYTLGDPNNVPLVSALGQDNVGVYVDGDNVTVNDVNIKNCDFGDRYANLDTVGNVMEINGDDVTVKNTRLSNGRNVLRSFSSMRLSVKNCMLSYARNFLFVSGANEYVPIHPTDEKSFIYNDGSMKMDKVGTFLSKGGEGDIILQSFLSDTFQGVTAQTAMKKKLASIQNALSQVSAVEGQYKGSTVIEDTLFYKSGIASICAETLFNGPFLYSATPSLLTEMFSMITDGGKPIIPYTPTFVSGISYPVEVEVKGATKFYDYKTSETMELDGLISENISAIVNSTGIYDGQITIDDIFPLKPMFMKGASAVGGTHSAEEKVNVNVPVAYYGGGTNLSKVSFDGIDAKENYSDEFNVDITGEYLKLNGGGTGMSAMKNVLLRTVTTVTGFEPFAFRTVKNGYLYNEAPSVFEMMQNAKGE